MSSPISKTNIWERISYTELVYDRIRKKLNIKASKEEIETHIRHLIADADERFFKKIGKNFYITHPKHHIRITINANTYRIITVDRIKEKQAGK